MTLGSVLQGHRQNNYAARVQVRCPGDRTVELQTALNEGALHLNRLQTRRLLVRRRHRGGAADGRIGQALGQLAAHGVEERDGRTVSPEREGGGGVLGSQVECNSDLGNQGAAVAAQGNQAVLGNLAEGLKGRTLAAVNGLRVGAGEGENLLALRVVVQGFQGEVGHVVSPKRGARVYACSLNSRSMGVLTALRARTTASSSGAS